MTIRNVPETFAQEKRSNLDLFVHDFKMTDDISKSKVNLSLNMFCLLQKGQKQVHFADSSVIVDSRQSLLIKKGNCIWSELLDKDDVYYCKLLFFSESRLKGFLKKYGQIAPEDALTPSYFLIENDEYIHAYIDSLSTILAAPRIFLDNLIATKFEELMLYLTSKYGNAFENYLHSLISKEYSTLRDIVENNLYSNLKIDDIAFLCHMSLSTFKRNFKKEYHTSPGHYLHDKRLHRAKELMEQKDIKATDVYRSFGYKNLSNFSAAFKNKFGKSPNLIDS